MTDGRKGEKPGPGRASAGPQEGQDKEFANAPMSIGSSLKQLISIQAESELKLRKRECKTCERTFTIKRKTAMFCSNGCRAEYGRLRAKGEVPQLPGRLKSRTAAMCKKCGVRRKEAIDGVCLTCRERKYGA